MRSGDGAAVVASDSDSDSPFAPSRKRSHVPTPPDFSDSDSSPPRSKTYCPHPAVSKMFLDLKEGIQSINSKLQESDRTLEKL